MELWSDLLNWLLDNIWDSDGGWSLVSSSFLVLVSKDLVSMHGDLWDGESSLVGWTYSEKLDGTRAFWDGGVSRGMLARDVPWANCVKGGEELICSGFWSRYWKPIIIPDEDLDRIIETDLGGESVSSTVFLEGEFWLGRGRFQESRSFVGRTKNLVSWPTDLCFYAFDVPSYREANRVRTVPCPGYKFQFPGFGDLVTGTSTGDLATRPLILKLRGLGIRSVFDLESGSGVVRSMEGVTELRDSVVASGGEGLILRAPGAYWRSDVGRSRSGIVKMKKEYLATCVVGDTWKKGKGKYRGMVGSYYVKGVSDHSGERVSGWCSGMPDELRDGSLVGSTVKVKYMELTDAGMLRSARIVGT